MSKHLYDNIALQCLAHFTSTGKARCYCLDVRVRDRTPDMPSQLS